MLSSIAQEEVVALRATLTSTLAGCRHLQEAAQLFVEALASAFPESLVLSRVYVVAPSVAVPQADRDIADAIARGAGAKLENSTPLLSLLGSAGRQPAWNDRGYSRNHRVIPLLNSTYVEEIPMVAGLLSDLGVNLGSFDTESTHRMMLGGLNGIFYVEDATTARDTKDRLLIPAQDFVKEFGVKTVFGMGGAYLDGTLVVAVLFCSETVREAIARRLALLISHFKVQTEGLVRSHKLYDLMGTSPQ